MSPSQPAAAADSTLQPEVSERIEAERTRGRPLDPAVREEMEPAFGQSFESVRVHTDSMSDKLAEGISAKAFTSGSDVFFEEGAYDAASTEGKRTLAHELTHVVQQGQGLSTAGTLSSPGDASEVEASRMAQMVTGQGTANQVGVTSQPAVQRATTEDGVPPMLASPLDQTDNLAKLATFKANAQARYDAANQYASKALAIGDVTREKLLGLSDVYTQAFLEFQSVLTKAEEEAQNQQTWTNIVVGGALSVTASVLAGWIAPSTLTGWLSLTLAEAVSAAGSGAAQATGATVASFSLGSATAVEGQDIDTAGIDPTIMQMGIWKNSRQIYRSGLAYNSLQAALQSTTVNLAEMTGEVRAYGLGGTSYLTPETLTNKMENLAAIDAKMADFDVEIATKTSELDKIKEAVDQIDPSAHSATDMEKKIWQLWIAELPYRANLLDLDAIEEHIGPDGLGLIDFGDYTSDEDEELARGEMIIAVNEMERQQIKAEEEGAAALVGGLTQSIIPSNVAPVNSSEAPQAPGAEAGGDGAGNIEDLLTEEGEGQQANYTEDPDYIEEQ